MGWHVTFRLWSDRVIAPEAGGVAAAADALTRLSGEEAVLAWHLADTHGHLLLLGSRRRAGEAARRLLIALHRRLRLEEGFQPARFTEVRDQRHLRSAFWYILRQAEHHGLQEDPWALGSCLPGLVGARLGGGALGDRVARHLPRVREEDLCARLGWSGLVPDDLGEGVGELALLGESAALAVGRLGLEGRWAELVAARRAAVRLGLEVARPTQVASALGVSPRTVRRLRDQSVQDEVIEVVRRSWAWRVERVLRRG